MRYRWHKDNFGALNLHVPDADGRDVWAYIQQRPTYCDRGHYQLNIEGPLGLDGHDMFPRYYMSLATAMTEAELFLNWRLHKNTIAYLSPEVMATNDGKETCNIGD